MHIGFGQVIGILISTMIGMGIGALINITVENSNLKSAEINYAVCKATQVLNK